MSAIAGTTSASKLTNETKEKVPVPQAVPGEFLVRLGEGWGGSLHDLANGIAVWGQEPEDAVRVLLSCLEFVELEAEGVEASLVEGMLGLRGAVMTAGIEAVGTMRDNNTDQ